MQVNLAYKKSYFGNSSGSAKYRWGFNGMEKDDVIKGNGNSYTSFYRQYDPRLGRWFTIDPEIGYMPWQSPYVSMDNNPIYHNDPFGNCTDCPKKISEYDEGTVRTAANLFKKNITDEGIEAKDFDFNKLDVSAQEEITDAIKTNPDVRGAFNLMVKQQQYLETHQGKNPAYANFIDDLMKNISTVGDFNAVAELRESLKGRLQGEIMMKIFSVENVGTILALWSPSGKFKRVRGKSFGSKNISLIRSAYVKNVNGLAALGKTLLKKGVSKEMTARILHAQRRYLGKVFKDATPPDMLKKIFDRNLRKYGDKWGPSIEFLRKQGKTWEEIIESSSRAGGKDLGF